MSQSTSATEPLYSTLGGDPDLAEIVDMFVDEMPERVATIQRQLDSADWSGLQRSAHQLKGAAGSYGFDPISPAAARLESALMHDAAAEQIRDAVDDLVELCNRVQHGSPA